MNSTRFCQRLNDRTRTKIIEQIKPAEMTQQTQEHKAEFAMIYRLTACPDNVRFIVSNK